MHGKDVVFWTVSALALSLTSPAFAEETPGGLWATLAPAPTKRTEVVATTVNGKIYVIGGFSEPGFGNLTSLAVADTVEAFDPATNRWETKAPLPVRLHHAGAASVGGKLYVAGGYTRSFLNIWHPVASLYMYDPQTDTWVERAPMPTARGALAVATHAGKLYAIGGYDRTTNSAAVEVYDPDNNNWSTKALLPTPRDHLALAAVGPHLYALGGRRNGNYAQNLAITEAYDPQADRWTRMADLPTARSGITAGVILGTIYVLGGEAPEGTFRTNEAYRPESDRWQAAAPMPTGRHGLGSAVVNDRLYVIGGGPTPGGSFSDVNEAFTPPGGPAADPHNRTSRSRASPKQVGAVMALLAAFDDAGALPPESSPEANGLIKALIQFQAAFMKSSNPAVQALLRDALIATFGERGPAAVEEFHTQGWTSRSLEALVDYTVAARPWDRAEVLEGLRAFNIGPSDFELLSRTFRAARSKLTGRGQDLHVVYAARRREMPGAGL